MPTKLTLRKIISGGQTGADTGALLAARELGLETGGSAPKGWLTENGPQEAFLRSFGLIECELKGYPVRTRRNVERSDGTLLIGPLGSGGSKLTYEIATEVGKPLFQVPFPGAPDTKEFRSWLERYDIKTLNLAGNRESESPGIANFTRMFLIAALNSQF